MSSESIGNRLNRIVSDARGALFEQGELAQLTYGAFDIASRTIEDHESDEIEITYPVGYRSDRQPIETTWTYAKADLLARYQFLAFQQLAINGLVQMVTIVEAMLGDVIRAVVLKYPQKLGGKRQIPLQAVLQAHSIEEIHLRATDSLLNELGYKSPADFAESLDGLLAVNLLKCLAFHRYMEIKASRDIFIHNRGLANEIYIRKAGSHARVEAGYKLPADVPYFLESYEACLQLADWLEERLHEHWHSSECEERKDVQTELALPTVSQTVTPDAASTAPKEE
jgi:hypothetical protein